ncbi:MAG: hypothetical protein U0930_12260 [Pirellulales bacterium]
MSRKMQRRLFLGSTAGSLLAAGAVTSMAQEPEKPVREPREAKFERDYDAPKFKPSWAKEQINRQLLQDFVILAHSDFDMVKKLLEREPGLINGAVDWGAGDFETALGGASHMGRHDIVEFLLEKGARIDIFCAAMTGQLEAVRSFLTLQPALIDAKGPHGFTLHFHARSVAKNLSLCWITCNRSRTLS